MPTKAQQKRMEEEWNNLSDEEQQIFIIQKLKELEEKIRQMGVTS